MLMTAVGVVNIPKRLTSYILPMMSFDDDPPQVHSGLAR